MHHQQQQIAALLSAATSNSASTAAAAGGGGEKTDESNRVAAINSLHRLFLYPPNSVVVAHSATFLCQGLFQLLSDKSYPVRRAAATAYGALCAILSSVPLGSNGRHNHVILGSLVERFVNWLLPLLSNNNSADGSAELALECVHEFLSVGDVAAIERYSFPILKACQELLEDERTSLALLHKLLCVLTVLSLKFFRCFQPHFIDIIDLLLGWAMIPDLAESDTRMIIGSFVQFQKHWVSNIQFPLGLLSKFLGDMDMLVRDASSGTPQQFRRLLALLSCFCTVLQSTASGMLEMNCLNQIVEPLNQMISQLLGCLPMVGRKFGWSKWNEDLWRCLTLLAEILGDKFATFYPFVVDILFQNLDFNDPEPLVGGRFTSTQIHGVLKTNLQLLSLQKLGLLASSVRKILQFDAPISLLRLHPNHLVTSVCASTYIFLLQHGNNEVVECSIDCLFEEMVLLNSLLENINHYGYMANHNVRSFSRLELLALFKFDLKVMLTSVSMVRGLSLLDQPDMAKLHLRRSEKVVSSIIAKLNPVSSPITGCLEQQMHVFETLGRLSSVEFLSRCSIQSGDSAEIALASNTDTGMSKSHVYCTCSTIVVEYMKKYSPFLVEALEFHSPLAVKLKALDWIRQFCYDVSGVHENLNATGNSCENFGCSNLFPTFIFSVICTSLDREPRVRSQGAIASELLLRAKLVHPSHFYPMMEMFLDKLGDPDPDARNAFVNLLACVLPATVYAYGLHDKRPVPEICSLTSRPNLWWKQIFFFKQLPQRIHSQQLVSILGYLSQRWKVPLSYWIQRLIHICQRTIDSFQPNLEETDTSNGSCLWTDLIVEESLLQSAGSVNNLAAMWWALNEAARFCTATRLRTNLGGPTQTFAALERMLLDVAHVLRIEAEQNDGTLSIVGSSGAHLLPMRLLLDFVEALKKNVFNAYEGSSVLPSASRQSSLFFRANKKVCEEWFSRICDPMMNAALALQCHDATIHYCSLRLQELSYSMASALNERPHLTMSENLHSLRIRLFGDFLTVSRHMALTLCKKREPKALIGLHKWVYETFSSLLVKERQILRSSELSGALLWFNGLIYEAEGQYEKANAFFAHLLQTEESLNSMGAESIQFIISRTIEGYTAISDWKSLESWLLELQSLRAKHHGKSYSGALTTAGHEMNAVHALAHFDEGDLQASWASLDLTSKSSSELTLDPKSALQRSEQMLLQAMLYQKEGEGDKPPFEAGKAKLMLDEVLSKLPLDGLVEAAPYAIQIHCISALEEGCRINGNENELKQSYSGMNLISHLLGCSFSSIHQDCSLWMKVFRVYRTVKPTSPLTLQLCKNLMSLARKQRNLGLANRLKSYLADQVDSCSVVSRCNFLKSSLQYEGILLIHAENRLSDAVKELWKFVRPCLASLQSLNSESQVNYLKAKACLKLSTWLKQDSHISLQSTVSDIYANIKVTAGNEQPGEDTLVSAPDMNQMIDEISGLAMKTSTLLCPEMGKSWIMFGSWCFGQAKDALSSSDQAKYSRLCHSLGSEKLPQKWSLTTYEVSRVELVVSSLLENISVLNPSTEEGGIVLNDFADDASDVNPAQSLSKQVVALIESAAGAAGAEDFDGPTLSTTLASHLRMKLRNINIDESLLLSSVDDLVNIWWNLRRRRVNLFGLAAHGFLKYLSYSSCKTSLSSFSGYKIESLRENSGSLTLRATLHILHILLNFGVELKDMLEPALSAVPLLPWQEVTPQLFARLTSHHEHVVRKQLEGLLMMLAKLSPWSIVYPTLVDVSTSAEEPPEELQHILDCLMKLYPRLVQDVRLMMHELGNVTVLWEELWLSTLQDLHGDVMRRINLLKEEAARISENTTLSLSEKSNISAARYSAMMTPVFVALERRLASVSRKPETPHEKWFQTEYVGQIRSAISLFKVPPTSNSTLVDVWRPFANIASSLAAYQRKSSISLDEVAPQLASLSSCNVPMPGLEKRVEMAELGEMASTSEGIITVASFSQQVAILPTKTKPKKLIMIGSDGENYTYLLKGREDLRLDARIMQLLEAANKLLQSSSETKGCSLGIRYYSVTPISGCAGLIQWVDNVISIYSVFKSWQQRVHFNQLSTSTSGSSKNSASVPVPRPSDMFYGKIIPALKEKGIRRVISRRDWPHEVKRKVLLDLMKEAPRQVLYQELWCASEDFKAFSSKQKRYSGSLAAMSIVGHILGLGDRHLDNILIDFVSGDIVHIDYNVCFDKGQRLKVPEVVPFRLTQTLEAGLGLTGVEGVFRANCESVLSVLRKNKDILLMLMAVFVWDPLVEWTRGNFHDDTTLGGEERKGMELAVSLSLFASRVQEIRVPLQEHHDLFLATFPAIESAFERFSSVLNQYELVSALLYRVEQERSSLLVHETSAKSMVAEATFNSDKTLALYEIQAREFAQAKVLVFEKAQEATTWIEQHRSVLDAIRSGSVPDIAAHIKLSERKDTLNLMSAVPAAGVPLTIVPEPTQAQCYDIDREITQVIADMEHGVSCAVSSLQAYSQLLQRVLPLNYIVTSPVYGWAQALQLSTNSISSEALSYARRQAGELVAKGHGGGSNIVLHDHEEMCSRVEKYMIEIERLEHEYDELMNSVKCEADLESKERLLFALLKHVQSAGLAKKEDPASSGKLDVKVVLFYTLYEEVFALYGDAKKRTSGLINDSTAQSNATFGLQSDSEFVLSELEEWTEKCNLLEEIVDEVRKLLGNEVTSFDLDQNFQEQLSNAKWPSAFREVLVSCKGLVDQMVEVVMQNLMELIISANSDVMDASRVLHQIQESVQTTLEQLVEVQAEKASLAELEKSYFVKVGQITEQQLALEEASMKGRDHLSWEEAEEIASQEEACKAQLDHLHQTWNQKDTQVSSLVEKENMLKSTLASSERHFLSLLDSLEERNQHVPRSNVLLLMLARPFSDLESLDRMMAAYNSQTHYTATGLSELVMSVNSGCRISEYVWKLNHLLDGRSFFIWKVVVMVSILDLILRDVSSSMDQSLAFYQLTGAIKEKLNSELKGMVAVYLKERIAPALLVWLDSEKETLKQHVKLAKENGLDKLREDTTLVKNMQRMLKEYINAHEAVRTTRSAATSRRRLVNDLKEAIRRTSLEIVQMEWIHDLPSNSQKSRIIFQDLFENDDMLSPHLLNLSRPKLLESLNSSVSVISRSIERLHNCERTTTNAEGQLETAMVWACGGPNSGTGANSSQKGSVVPPEFHDHLKRRRQLLYEAREKADNLTNVCRSILEFEGSRDGFFTSPEHHFPHRIDDDDKSWQQSYLSALTRLDITFHTFSCAEQEWKLARSNIEAASNGLVSASNEFHTASLKAKTASDDLQSTLLQMRDCAYEASVALSAFNRVTMVHTVLTTESGSMLEEVLAITEDLHDVYNLGKEAASVHHSLVETLSKASKVLLPLESVLSKDVAMMTEAMSRERGSGMEISPIHGQAIYQSYCIRIREASQNYRPLVPLLMSSVKELYSLLMKLAQTASVHAGNLHKALEGLGEHQEARSEEIALSRANPDNDTPEFCDVEGTSNPPQSDLELDHSSSDNESSSLERGWISPPDSMLTSSSSESDTATDDVISKNGLSCLEAMDHLSLSSNSEVVGKITHISAPDAEVMLQSGTSESSAMRSKPNDLDSATTIEPNQYTEDNELLKESSPDTAMKGEDVDINTERIEDALSWKTGVEPENGEGPPPRRGGDYVTRGKNAFAESVLRRIEMKLDGRDITENREYSVAEQVDYLLKQAMSVDNLCNMYEGWTPWI